MQQDIYSGNFINAIHGCQPIRITDMNVYNDDPVNPAPVKFIVEFYNSGVDLYGTNDPAWPPLSPAPSGSSYEAWIYTVTVAPDGTEDAPDLNLMITSSGTTFPIQVYSLSTGVTPNPGTNPYNAVLIAEVSRELSGDVDDLPTLDKPDCDPLENPAGNYYRITGDLNVNEDFCMKYTQTTSPSAHIRAKYYVYSGAKITVQSGFSLTMIEADVIGCDEMWKGIEVQEGATLVADNVEIDDARYAIDAKAGSTLQVNNSTFTDNYIALNLDMNGAGGGVPHRVNLLGLADNTFRSSDNGLKTPYTGMPEAVEPRGYCGIRLNGYQDFNAYGANNFTRLTNGLVATNSILNVGGMSFSDMRSTALTTHSYPREGFGMYLEGKGNSAWANVNELWLPAMNFSGCKTGIYAVNMAGRVDNCFMDKVGTGIEWWNSRTRDVRLRQNDITANNYGIRSFANEPLHPISIMAQNTIEIEGAAAGLQPVSGISLQEHGLGHDIGTSPVVNGWLVQDNTITMDKNGYGIDYVNGALGNLILNTVTNSFNDNDNNYTGIHLNGTQFAEINGNNISQSAPGLLGISTGLLSSGGYANGFTCNMFNNSDVGMQFFDLADYTDAVRGNSFGDHSVGLQLGDEGNGGVYIGVQDHTGNLWDLGGIPIGGFGGVHWGAGLISYSRFVVGDEVNTTVHPPVDPEDWFQYLKGDEFADCSSYATTSQPPALGEDDLPSDLDNAIVGDSLPTIGCDTALQWKGKYREYRKILRHPGWTTTYASYATFKTANDSLSTGRLAYIAEERSKLFDLTTGQLDTLDGFRAALEAKQDTLLRKDSLVQISLYTIDSPYNGLVQRRRNVLMQEETYRADLQEDRLKKIDDLLDLNAVVTTTLLIDGNHKKVNDIVLNLLASDTLRAGDLDTLTVIANECPLEGGDAVYEARSIVTAYTGAAFDDSDLCEDSDDRSNKSKKAPTQTPEIVLYPNPASDYLYWSGVTEPVTIRVFNALGVLQLEQKSAEGFLSTGPLASGFYTLQFLRLDQTVLSSQKLLITKH